MKGFDCSTPLTAAKAKQLYDSGMRFVLRYYSKDGSWKLLTKTEADNILAAGLQLGAVFERYPERVKEGESAGKEDGLQALKCAQEVGQPQGSTIYFAVDFDAQQGDMEAIERYLRAIDIPGYEKGVYGSFYVIEEMAKRGVVSHYWQTIGWSNGRWSKLANIHQYQIDKEYCEVNVDFNESFGNEGFWGREKAEEVEDVKLELWQWKMLGDALDGLYRKGIISDYTWAEKAYKQELTPDEAVWLQMIMFARQNGIQI